MQKKLKDLKCEACSGNTPKLTDQEISDYLMKINNWQLNDNKDMIFKKFIFKNFREAIKFLNMAGDIAELENHHFDSSIGYGYCLLFITTHKISALSINDFILASKIDLIK